MRLELLSAALLGCATALLGSVMGRRDGVALILAVFLGAFLAVLETCISISAGLDRVTILRAVFGGCARALATALIHIAVGRTFLLPFSPNLEPEPPTGTRLLPSSNVVTLERQPLAAGVFLAFLSGGVHLILGVPQHAALGAVLVTTAPFLAALVLVGASVAKPDVIVLAMATPMLLVASSLTRDAQLIDWTLAGVNKQLPGLPADAVARDILCALATTLLLHLVAHIHALLVLSPTLPPAPPASLSGHLRLLVRVVANPPELDKRVLLLLQDAPPLPRAFRLAALAAPRELRIALTAVNWWYTSTASLARAVPEIDDVEKILSSRRRALGALRLHLLSCYQSKSQLELALILCTVPLEAAQQEPYYLFAALIPRIAPLWPFLEILTALKIDANFLPVPALTESHDLSAHLPFDTPPKLEAYASALGGGLAAACCYLAWSILDSSPAPLQPTRAYNWSQSVHPDATPSGTTPGLSPTAPVRTLLAAHTILSARIMGRGMLLVSLAASASDDCARGRVYLPLCVFKTHTELADLLHGGGAPLHVFVPVLRMAERAREDSESSISGLPKSARSAIRAAIAAAYTPACCLWEGAGETGKICTCNRSRAVVQAIWGS
ncbi:hypothetical protein CcaverHIS002_0208580 [Cutaneotrichosporon cavernicola]|uniref:Uncharacterized protein n=1 Tax=Cutaneotrichosporon cavernicola TaxID=279322 RepID=A0AA48L1T5_9TREE|nr:uncharacterized protein CcaverHIS019_0208590 [Cutaneotrichosporon cavernicola]BEI81698.1 hypothetical protein CcaverHIS002_0208580 [Cutaneotrichosporon cavernicola]BEI89497.1 hypothetical protein CcaverHIS019_0208590 [Cutaneotrichosporon cavernicola]BEI97270.1 hypothetical protein CcaverHIS631_0208590 [Cutaneotrichosporon cavernicola]BEJ05044.1 hypothetical protein CcaverHIS641_0208610 [Cutaneotrichosporon cavernicola]